MPTKDEWVIILGGLGAMFFLFWILLQFILTDVYS